MNGPRFFVRLCVLKYLSMDERMINFAKFVIDLDINLSFLASVCFLTESRTCSSNLPESQKYVHVPDPTTRFAVMIGDTKYACPSCVLKLRLRRCKGDPLLATMLQV